jgi:hypothetical protein
MDRMHSSHVHHILSYQIWVSKEGNSGLHIKVAASPLVTSTFV